MRKLTAATAAAIVSVIVISAPNGRGALAQSATIELQATVSVGDTTLRRAASIQRQLDLAARSAMAASPTVRKKLSTQQAASLKSIGRDFAVYQKPVPTLQKWEAFITSAKPASSDVGALVQEVMRESYRQQTEDLRFHAEKLKRRRELMAALQRERQAARDYLVVLEAGGRATGFTPNPSFGRRQGLRTPAQVRAYLRALDQTMQRTAEDTQLANVDLQNILQKQQQTLQMMSNISKMLHDTAMSVIRKIGG
jgi:hypothetical protein